MTLISVISQDDHTDLQDRLRIGRRAHDTNRREFVRFNERVYLREKKKEAVKAKRTALRKSAREVKRQARAGKEAQR